MVIPDLTYFPVSSLEEGVEVFKRETLSQADSVEGIMFTRDKGVIMSGNFVEGCSDK